MSWIKDLDGDLINLDHAQTLDVVDLNEPTEHESHCLIASFPAGDPRTLDVGTEDEMRNKQALIAQKLPMVKLV